MSKVFIHIGLHKTATTFLQNSVFTTLNNTTYLSRPYTQLNHAFNKLQYADDSRYDPQDIFQELSQIKQGNQNLLISDEMLSGIPNFNYVNRSVIAHRLKQSFQDATIILFLRNQTDLILSLYNTWIKNLRGTRTLTDFVTFPSKNYRYDDYDPRKMKAGQFGGDTAAYYFWHDRLTLNLSNFFYYELVNLYKSLFQNVHVFLFEDFQANPSAVIGQLEEILGDSFADLSLGKLSKRSNVSSDSVSLEGKRFRNALQALSDNRILLKAAELCGKASALLPKRESGKSYLKNRINGFYTENNRILEQAHPDIQISKYPDKYQL